MLLSVVPFIAATSVQLVTGAVLVLASVMLAQYPPPHESTVMVALTPLLERSAVREAVARAESGLWPQASTAAPRTSAVSVATGRDLMICLLGGHGSRRVSVRSESTDTGPAEATM